MARTKLGLSSSLAAARLLAEADGYQPLVPQNSDLSDRRVDAAGGGAAGHFGRSLHPLVKGAGMIAAITLVALLSQDAVAPIAPPANAEAYVAQMQKSGKWRKADTAETAEYLKLEFKRADKNGDGFVDLAEMERVGCNDPAVKCGPNPTPPPAGSKMSNPADLLVRMDTNRDGKVSEGEQVAYMMPWMLWQGVPSNWREYKDR